eukprot:3386848-Karenia_brevis.AAC.1
MGQICSGDFVGQGPLMIAIARQNGNHFVPLLENINVAGSEGGQEPNADVHCLDFDSAVNGGDSSIFGDSEDSSDSSPAVHMKTPLMQRKILLRMCWWKSHLLKQFC